MGCGLVVQLFRGSDGQSRTYFYQGSQYCSSLWQFNSLVIYGQLAQWAASRTDLFPTLLCERMGKMHSQGRPHSLAHTKRVIERVFQRPFDDVFEEFDETPIGSGAIAQVCCTSSYALSDFIELKHFRGVQSHDEAGSTSALIFRPKAGSKERPESPRTCHSSGFQAVSPHFCRCNQSPPSACGQDDRT